MKYVLSLVAVLALCGVSEARQRITFVQRGFVRQVAPVAIVQPFQVAPLRLVAPVQVQSFVAPVQVQSFSTGCGALLIH